MSKRELIDAIRQHNRTVAPEFLARFAESDLKEYLDRICMTAAPEPPPRVCTTLDARQQLVIA